MELLHEHQRATSTTIAYSIIGTAKENGLDVFKYLRYLFEELPVTPFQESPELLDAYLSWSQKIQQICK